MEIVRHHTAASFLACAGPWLAAHETTNHLIFALAARDTPGAFLATVEDVGVALQTPPYPLLISDLPGAAFEPLIEAIVASGFAPSGVNGPDESARAFASRWCARHGLTAAPRMRMRSHVLERVTPAGRSPGAMRRATEDDLSLLVRWYEIYFGETRSPNHELPEAIARRLLPMTFLWEHDALPVSMAAVAGQTPRGRRIGYVFSPPEHRRRGHAEALVAVLSQRILDEGARWCFLFTDTDNPTSNAIYRRIGYEPNGEIEEIGFSSRGGASAESSGTITSR